MEFCLNEQSLVPFSGVEDSFNPTIVKDFLWVLKTAKNIGGEIPVIRMQEKMWEQPVGNQCLDDFLKKHCDHGDHDEYILLLSVIGRSSLLPKVFKVYNYNGFKAQGLSACLALDCPAISFASSDSSKKEIINLVNDSHEVGAVFNFTSKDQFERYSKFIGQFEHCQNYIRELQNLKDCIEGKDFWPHLRFPDDFEKLELEKSFILPVVACLCKLNEFLDKPVDKQLTFSDLKLVFPEVRIESQTVLNNYKMRQERSKYFNGELVYCLMHIDLSKAYRFYFCIEYKSRMAYIGHIGNHLTTGRYKRN